MGRFQGRQVACTVAAERCKKTRRQEFGSIMEQKRNRPSNPNSAPHMVQVEIIVMENCQIKTSPTFILTTKFAFVKTFVTIISLFVLLAPLLIIPFFIKTNVVTRMSVYLLCFAKKIFLSFLFITINLTALHTQPKNVIQYSSSRARLRSSRSTLSPNFRKDPRCDFASVLILRGGAEFIFDDPDVPESEQVRPVLLLQQDSLTWQPSPTQDAPSLFAMATEPRLAMVGRRKTRGSPAWRWATRAAPP